MDFDGKDQLMQFQPTPSARRVTAVPHYLVYAGAISTHTLRKEGDRRGSSCSRSALDFNPHPPQGG